MSIWHSIESDRVCRCGNNADQDVWRHMASLGLSVLNTVSNASNVAELQNFTNQYAQFLNWLMPGDAYVRR